MRINRFYYYDTEVGVGYFKCKEIKDKFCIGDYVVSYNGREYRYFEYTGGKIVSYETSILVEVDISIFVDYLPSNNLDKIAYLRKKKIEFLININ